MTDTNDIITAYLTELGRRGGIATKQRHPDQFRKMGQLGAKRRWQTYRFRRRRRHDEHVG